MSEKPRVHLGVDNGTQGLTVLVVEEISLQILAKGEGSYGFVPNLPDGCYEQMASDWEMALKTAIQQVATTLQNCEVVGIGIAGQMHGCVLVDTKREMGQQVLGPVRLWCDARNQGEAEELSLLFGSTLSQKDTLHLLPKRCTAVRWLWTLRHQAELAQATNFVTTPAGWLAYRLTQRRVLGVGDASGMFPMDTKTTNYRQDWLELFEDTYTRPMNKDGSSFPSLSSILPSVVSCGEDAGELTEEAARWLGLPAGIPVAAAEGDQPAALAGSFMGRPGTISCSFGTSVCANVVGSSSLEWLISPAVNQFCTVNGQPLYMVWLRNGTTFFNSVISSMTVSGNTQSEKIAAVMPAILSAPSDCGGLLALPFMDDEPGLGVRQGGTGGILGWTPTSDLGCVGKAALLSSMYNLYRGVSLLSQDWKEVSFSGGLSQTVGCGQWLADIFNVPVTVWQGAEEGCAMGAAILSLYRRHVMVSTNVVPWVTFLEGLPCPNSIRMEPKVDEVRMYRDCYERYERLLALQPELERALSR